MAHKVELNLESLQGEKLGRGCYSTVYAFKPDPDRWVLKVGSNDGTRVYLEWCKRRQSMGQGLRGMPRVAWVADTEDGGYAAVLERLPIDPGRECEHGWKKYIGAAVYNPADHVPYLRVLVDAMRDECDVSGCDMHYQNFLVRKDGTVVMTDPDSGCYYSAPCVNSHPERDPTGPAVQQDLFAHG